MKNDRIHADKAPKPVGLYPHARKVGFKNVRLVLEEAGSSWDNLVDVTVFLTDMKRDFQTYNRIYAEYFKDNQPCRTTVAIDSLPTPIAIELKCIATI
jgi:2-aminomuconate deaminase